MLNMFRALIYPSSGTCDYSVELPHCSYCSWFDVCRSFGLVGLEWYPCCRLEFWCYWVGMVSVLQASACNTDTTPTQPHRKSNTHRTKNNTTNVVIQQNRRKFLMMDILMSETSWAHKKWNKIASDIKLVFYSSTWKNLLAAFSPQQMYQNGLVTTQLHKRMYSYLWGNIFEPRTDIPTGISWCSASSKPMQQLCLNLYHTGAPSSCFQIYYSLCQHFY